jgi:hypothetical protein
MSLGKVDLSYVNQKRIEIESIEAYIKTYHVYNFDKVYQAFDSDQFLLDSSYKEVESVAEFTLN